MAEPLIPALGFKDHDEGVIHLSRLGSHTLCGQHVWYTLPVGVKILESKACAECAGELDQHDPSPPIVEGQ